MNVLIISTTEKTGGGAIAARRLMEALNKNGVNARMLVRDKQTDSPYVVSCGNIIPKVLERMELIMKLRLPWSKTWPYDTAGFGLDIMDTPEYRNADVIHLHWINQGMLSLRQLERMVRDGKRIVWTLHDEWPFSGIKHYNGDIGSDTGIEKTVRFCRLDDRIRNLKRQIYASGNIHFVGCSQWITDLAGQAMPDQECTHVNNCIPHDIFHPMDKQETRRKLNLPPDKKIVLFCSQKVTDKRKGMAYLDEALQRLSGIHVVRLGGGGTYISDEKTMAMMYAAVDCFVTPSLQDNLPNTIAEAMSCGTPCVGFDTGGIPEMIHHRQDGYIARYCDSNDLAEGIRFVFSHPELRQAAASSALKDYSESSVAQEYIRIYEQ